VQCGALAASYNDALRELAKRQSLPLIDFEREILARRPNDWDGTLPDHEHRSGDKSWRVKRSAS
jgi:hypothetical protein